MMFRLALIAAALTAQGGNAFAPTTSSSSRSFSGGRSTSLRESDAAATPVEPAPEPETEPEPESIDAAAPVAVAVMETAVEEVAAVEEVPAFVGFANGYVGGEGPEPILLAPDRMSMNFDPMGFAERSPEWLPWYREAELKHCRVAMLAVLGLVVPEFIRVPGEQFSKENIPFVIEAHDKLPNAMILIFGAISFLEACTLPAIANLDGFDRGPGDYSFDPLGFYPAEEEKQRERQLQELKNGRLAMIGLGGMVAQAAILTGTDGGVSVFPYTPSDGYYSALNSFFN